VISISGQSLRDGHEIYMVCVGSQLSFVGGSAALFRPFQGDIDIFGPISQGVALG
jgi:hypothetical protein